MTTRKNFAGFSLAILALNLVLLLHYAFVLLFNKVVPVSSFALYEGVGLFFNKNKIHELLVYSMDVVALFGLFTAYLLRTEFIDNALRKGTNRMYLQFHRNFIGATVFTLLLVFIPVGVCFLGSQNSLSSFSARLAGQTLLLTALWFSYFDVRKHAVGVRRWAWFNGNIVGSVLLIICYGQLVSLVYDPLVHRPKLVNEYYAIPEQTLLGGHYVDNTTYLRQSVKSPVFFKYDVRAGDVNSNVLKSDGLVKGFVFPHVSALQDLTANQ
ncbi:MAG: hypothetical protein LWW75_08015, partial [Chlorobiales bacterium]|nr:hypothetical protein [Chlorobiales bacterium]